MLLLSSRTSSLHGPPWINSQILSRSFRTVLKTESARAQGRDTLTNAASLVRGGSRETAWQVGCPSCLTGRSGAARKARDPLQQAPEWPRRKSCLDISRSRQERVPCRIHRCAQDSRSCLQIRRGVRPRRYAGLNRSGVNMTTNKITLLTIRSADKSADQFVTTYHWHLIR